MVLLWWCLVVELAITSHSLENLKATLRHSRKSGSIKADTKMIIQIMALLCTAWKRSRYWWMVLWCWWSDVELTITSHPPKSFNPRLRHNQTSENYKHYTKLIVSSRCTFFILLVFLSNKPFSEKNTKVMEVVGQTECHDSLKWGCGGDRTSVQKLQTAICATIRAWKNTWSIPKWWPDRDA